MKVLKLFKSLFIFELKRRLRLREIILFLLILLIFGYFVNDGKARYLDLMKEKKAFQEIEMAKLSKYVLYTQYGTYGLTILFVPSPFIVLYAESAFDDILTNVNSGDRLEIYKNLKGQAYFKDNSRLISLMGITLLFAICFSLLYGLDTTGKKAFLKYLSGLAKPGVLLFTMALVRMLLLILALLVIYGCSFLFLLSQGINLFRSPLLVICLVSMLLIGVFFFLGCVIGSIKSKAVQWIAFGAIFFASILLIPSIADKHIQSKAKKIESLNEFTIKNLALVMDLEKLLTTKYGISAEEGNEPQEALKKIKTALTKEFPIIFSNEDSMIEDMEEKITYRHTLSCFFPVLFYNTTVEELSSCGGKSFIDFYKFAKNQKMNFINYYVEKKFLSKSSQGKNAKVEKVESFVNHDENLFYARSRLPDLFGVGVGVIFLYIAVFAAVSFYRFKRGLHPVPPKGVLDGVDIDVAKGEEIYVKTCDSLFSDYFRAILTGKVDQGTVRINNRVVERGESIALTYLCRPEDIPAEVKTNSLLNLLAALIPETRGIVRTLKEELGRENLGKKFSDLPMGKQVKLLLLPALAADTPLYLVHGLADRCDKEASLEYEQKIRELLNKGGMAIYLSDAVYPNPNIKADRFYVVTRENTAYETREIK